MDILLGVAFIFWGEGGIVLFGLCLLSFFGGGGVGGGAASNSGMCCWLLDINFPVPRLVLFAILWADPKHTHTHTHIARHLCWPILVFVQRV